MSASLPPQQSSSQRRSISEAAPVQSPQESTSTPTHRVQKDEQAKEEAQASPSIADDNQPLVEKQSETTSIDNQEVEDKKCWICFSDATEDTPESSPWRSPCPCALVAHEACLLDWIADMEAPNRSRARTLAAPRIECPQCKGEIKLSRPRSYVVDAVRGVERWSSRAVTSGAFTLLFATVYHSSVAWGIHSIYAVFGNEDGFRILQPLVIDRVGPPIHYSGLDLLLERLSHWRLYVGLPLVTPLLIMSRTSIADSVLPVLPIVFFATQTTLPDDILVVGNWPPSASLAFAVLPYVRAAYNTYYRWGWAAKERRWLEEIQPRAIQEQANGTENAGADGEDAAAELEDDDNVFEIRVDGGIWDEWEDEADIVDEDDDAVPVGAEPQPYDNQQQQQPPQADAQLNADNPPGDIPAGLDGPPAEQQQAAPDAPQVQPGNNAGRAAGAGGGGERRLSFSPTAIATTVLGALVFPTIAGLSGEVLRLVLPRAWTTAPATLRLGMRTPARGMLQEKWGRSLIGGCLFVVLKDAVMLYARWKMAQMHRDRRVLDYDRPKKLVK